MINRKVLPLYHQYPPAMALPMLVGGSECGPSNPLQGLSKRFDQDRGLQQVRISSSIRPTSHLRRTPLGPLRRSSSRLLERCMSSFHETFLCLYLSTNDQAFRSQNVAAGGGQDLDAQQFFSAQAGGAHLASPEFNSSYDLSAMRAALPPSHMTQQPFNSAQLHRAQSIGGTHSTTSSSSAWAADFMMQPLLSSPASTVLASTTANFGTGVQQEQSIHGPVQPSTQCTWSIFH